MKGRGVSFLTRQGKIVARSGSYQLCSSTVLSAKNTGALAQALVLTGFVVMDRALIPPSFSLSFVLVLVRRLRRQRFTIAAKIRCSCSVW